MKKEVIVFQKEKDSIHYANEKERIVINQNLQQEKNIQYYAFLGPGDNTQ